jgi:hypothetical protein
MEIDINIIQELCDDYCYCETQEGTLYSEGQHGKKYCAFCWLMKKLEEEIKKC